MNIWVKLFICEFIYTFFILSEAVKQKLVNDESRLGKKR